ncbi:hypothetical protein ACFSTI_29380 [Rhizorhabdus histidinilytica]|uniref:Uncharacterized protein n=1 Tax=Rhizorhabdus histidinilytica TaxID=439228 RepID=A0A1T5CHC2_9SPHN|nr:hypothetical protein [Rhizorhabdus histidinilytica]SKB58868.1 hypothetical protein SAMN06295920_10466 [Rhizorhabdus histidinilytica]
MSAKEYVPFIPVLKPAIASTEPAIADGFEAGIKAARFSRFRDARRDGRESLAALATLAAPGRPWSEGLRLLKALPAPMHMPMERWDRLVWTCLQIDQQWGGDLVARGWDVLEVYGSNPDISAARADRNGLALLLWSWSGPIEIHRVDVESIVLTVDHGNQLRWRRFDRSRAVPVWEAYAMRGGP